MFCPTGRATVNQSTLSSPRSGRQEHRAFPDFPLQVYRSAVGPDRQDGQDVELTHAFATDEDHRYGKVPVRLVSHCRKDQGSRLS